MTDQVLHMPVTIETRQGDFIKAPSRSVLNAIAKANAEHALASDAVVNAMEAKNAAMRHAIACGKALLKAKERVGHGGWEGLFLGSNRRSEGSENRRMATLPLMTPPLAGAP